MEEIGTAFAWSEQPRGRNVWISPIPARTRRRMLVAAALVAADLLAGAAVLYATAQLVAEPFALGVMTLPLLIASYSIQGLYVGCGPCPCERLRMRGHGLGLFAATGFLIGAARGDAARLAAPALCVMLLLMFGYYAEALTRALLIRWGIWGAATAIVGSPARCDTIARWLRSQPEFGLLPVGYVALVPEAEVGSDGTELPVLGAAGDLVKVARDLDVVVFSTTQDVAALPPNIRRQLPARQLVMAGVAQNVQSLWLHTRTMGGSIGIELPCMAYLQVSRLVKRVMDLVLAVPACVLAAPIIGLVGLAVKIIDPGPVFYFQNRVGFNGKIVPICKIRTMYHDAEQRLEECLARDEVARDEWRRFYKLRNDPRILPVIGKIARRTSVDELPQLWQVVLGEMSLVGPRPFPSYHISSFDPEFQPVRASVPPGLTGLWQVGPRSNGDLEVQRAQDLFYVVNWSIWLDLFILLETPLAVVSGRGAM
jgi:lipopolysaccharide/colanic/teichoic acid biosynthesis glycosyltransferase